MHFMIVFWILAQRVKFLYVVRFSSEACGKVYEKKSCKSQRAPTKAPLKKSTKVNQSVVDALHKLIAGSSKASSICAHLSFLLGFSLCCCQGNYMEYFIR